MLVSINWSLHMHNVKHMPPSVKSMACQLQLNGGVSHNATDKKWATTNIMSFKAQVFNG